MPASEPLDLNWRRPREALVVKVIAELERGNGIEGGLKVEYQIDAGRRLVDLNLAHNKGLRDITALQGVPLVGLNLSGTAVTDLEALRGMPLRALHLRWCKGTRDLRPLLECPTLEKLSIPEHVTEVEFLRKGLKGLTSITYQ
ncbi:MAG: hypothetical protein JXR77_05385 [Lentisphaeria bacterium]|nr:hypothetical protein [Lentisphaeria bacterium]